MSPRASLRLFVDESKRSGVSVVDLAAAMGVSRATLYLLMDDASEQIATRRVANAIERIAGIPRTDWSPLYADLDDTAAA